MKTLRLKEKAHFFDYTQQLIDVKIDTGAESGALHAEDIKIIERDGKYILSFRPFGLPDTIEKDCFHTVRVKSSNGIMEQRFTVLTRITIAEETHKIRISLTDRSSMSHEVIIGRRFLKNKFYIDPR